MQIKGFVNFLPMYLQAGEVIEVILPGPKVLVDFSFWLQHFNVIKNLVQKCILYKFAPISCGCSPQVVKWGRNCFFWCNEWRNVDLVKSSDRWGSVFISWNKGILVAQVKGLCAVFSSPMICFDCIRLVSHHLFLSKSKLRLFFFFLDL